MAEGGTSADVCAILLIHPLYSVSEQMFKTNFKMANLMLHVMRVKMAAKNIFCFGIFSCFIGRTCYTAKMLK